MTKENNPITCTRDGMWPWIVLDGILILSTLIWLAFNYQKTNFFQDSADIPAGTSAAADATGKPALKGTPVGLLVNGPDQNVSISKVLQLVFPSIVTITSDGPLAQSGSGVIVHSQGFVITNHHVVDGVEKIIVSVGPDQALKNYWAQIVEFSEEWDLAVLKIVADVNERFPPVLLGDSSTALTGDNVLIVGSPYGLGQSVSSGIISNANRKLTTATREFEGLIQTDAPLNSGSSGGAMVNTSGEVIGINTAMLSNTQSSTGVGFAIPVNVVRKLFPKYVERATNGVTLVAMPVAQDLTPPGHVQVKEEPWLGVDTISVDGDVVKKFALPFDHGVLITRVYENSIAWRSGLRTGDVIYRINDRQVKDEDMLWDYFRVLILSKKVQFTLFRVGLPKFHVPLQIN
ncbi:MAG: trypsin-like peptidase domain-containing protein [Candidatus Riflebacteria bacterium]|nr:trypsin-like peptidase domain-containing protein [Candidatus Riflebacteria bacterium]